MQDQKHPAIQSAAIVLPCTDLDACIAFFGEALGFRVDTIFPADAPRVAVISAHGLRIRLQVDTADQVPGTILIECEDPSVFGDGESQLQAPNGTRIELVHATPALDAPAASVPDPKPTFSITRMTQASTWIPGRAGMQYRDLIPDRSGGHVIASHIKIPGGGPVPDYVHHHQVRFQAIFCYRGWVRVVYEGQGPPFVLEAGDCVLQPPGIRHRVLECSEGLEVIELACPAAHQTHLDHDLSLPTAVDDPHRSYGGQRFVRHQAQGSDWQPSDTAGILQQQSGIGEATDGLAELRVLKSDDADGVERIRVYDSQDAYFVFVLEGEGFLRGEHETESLESGDSVSLPGGRRFEIFPKSPATWKLLEVRLPRD